MEIGEEVRILGEFFKIHFTENKGAAFGLSFDDLLPGLSPTSGKVILSLFSLCAVFVIIFFLHSSWKSRTALPFLVATILGGAIGNIVDRFFYGAWFASINDYEGGLLFGRVVDMFYFDIWQGFLPNWIPVYGGKWYAFWPIFNLADMAIGIGIVSIFVFQKRLFKVEEEVMDIDGSLEEESSAEIEKSPAPETKEKEPKAEPGSGKL